jgi:hypothetical protein
MYGVSYCKMIMCKKCINKDKKRRKNEIWRYNMKDI